MRLKLPGFVVDWIIRRAQRTPYFDLEHEGSLYMQRWWIRQPPGHGAHASTYEKQKSGIGIRIHRTVRSDRGRDLHDHPWANISIVLRGGYWEILPIYQGQDAYFDAHAYKRVWRGPGSIIFRSARTRHRLEIPEYMNGKPGEAWSLFIMGPWQRDWGFHTPFAWVYWRNYIGIEADQDEDSARVARDIGASGVSTEG